MTPSPALALSPADLAGASFAQPKTPVQKMKFTFKQAIVAGFILGVLYTAGSAVVANRMVANGACTTSEYAGQS